MIKALNRGKNWHSENRPGDGCLYLTYAAEGNVSSNYMLLIPICGRTNDFIIDSLTIQHQWHQMSKPRNQDLKSSTSSSFKEAKTHCWLPSKKQHRCMHVRLAICTWKALYFRISCSQQRAHKSVSCNCHLWTAHFMICSSKAHIRRCKGSMHYYVNIQYWICSRTQLFTGHGLDYYFGSPPGRHGQVIQQQGIFLRG